MKDVVVIYHYPCLDGFGGAYAAWKKFGDNATYLPMSRSKLTAEGFEGKDVYFIDFTYPQDLTNKVVKQARSVTILDHHAGVKSIVKSVQNHVFDEKRSGATIGWNYFHPDKSLPKLFTYLEDIDLFLQALPSSKEVELYLSTQKFDFLAWDKLVEKFEDPLEFEEIKRAGAHFAKYHEQVLDQFLEQAFMVEFEGYTIYAANVPNFFASAVGNRLYAKQPPFALTWHVEKDVVRVSLRGNGEVDLAALARRHGGNGHHNAAGILVQHDDPLPFKRLV